MDEPASNPSTPSTPPGPRLHALLIGVGTYLPNRLPDGKRYESLFGPPGDVVRIEEYLRHYLRVPREHIRKLTSSPGSGAEPREAPEDRPSYENMVAAIERLGAAARPGDQILIHYSGHGGRTWTTLPELKGPGGVDECLVPHDIGEAGARYLRDTEIDHLLRGLVDRGLFVSLILDCCHAAGALRGEDMVPGTAVRGVEVIDSTERPQTSLLGPWQSLLAGWRKPREPPRGLRQADSWQTTSRGYVVLAACRPQEQAFEAVFEAGRPEGALTHSLLAALASAAGPMTWRQVYQSLLGEIRSRFCQQTPVLEGEGERRVFGWDEGPPPLGMALLRGEEDGGVTLAAGEVLNLRPGARLAVFSSSREESEALGGRLAVVQVGEVEATSARALITERAEGGRPLRAGDEAVLLDPGSLVVEHRVHRILRSAGTRLEGEAGAMERLEMALRSRETGLLSLEGEADVGRTLQVGVHPGGTYEIRDATGRPLALPGPLLPIADPRSPWQLVERLIHVACYRNVLLLENHRRDSALRGQVEVELARLPADYRPGDRLWQTSAEPLTGPIELEDGAWFLVQVSQHTRWALNLTVLGLQPDWAIAQIHPDRGRGSFEVLEAGATCRIAFRAALPPGRASGREILKVFATLEPVDFSWLALPALGHPLPRGRALRGGSRGKLEQLLAALVGEENIQPLSPVHLAAEWVVVDREVLIRR